MSKVTLTRDEKISWMMNAFACIITTEHYAVMERLTPLSHDDLDVLDRVASSGYADSLRDALLSDAKIEDIITASRLLRKYDRHHSVSSILMIIHALRELGLTLDKLEVHVRADIQHVFVSNSGMDFASSSYTRNPGMIALVDEYPERMIEITNFRLKRRTNDAELIREAISNTTPLAEGTL
jgi:hypothetical protein